MKKKMVIISVMLVSLFFSQQAMAQGSVHHSAQATAHSTVAVGHSTAGAAKLTSAAVAVPLVAAGAIGAVSAEAGKGLSKAANSPIGEPLEVSDETITAGPAPDQAIH